MKIRFKMIKQVKTRRLEGTGMTKEDWIGISIAYFGVFFMTGLSLLNIYLFNNMITGGLR